MRYPEPFVGRNQELSLLKARLESLRVGTSFVTSVVGEAGIGKTTFCTAVIQMAHDSGIRTVRSVSRDHGAFGSYWLWRTVLLQLGIPDPFDIDRGVSWLSDPVLRFQQELLVFEEVIGRICEVSGEKPLLIVLEDLHWADDGSLRLLSEFSSRLSDESVGVVVTYREHFEARFGVADDTLMSIHRLAQSEMIRLQPFTELETLELMNACFDGSDQDSSSRDSNNVFIRSAGNPLFVAELIQTLRSGTSVELPGTVRMVVEERISSLDPNTIEVLEICSLSSGEIERSVLEPVAETDSRSLDDIDAAMDEGIRRLFLFQRSDSQGVFEFRHPVVREVLASRIRSRRRSQIHSQYFEVLKHRYENRLQEHSDVLVFHAERAQPFVENIELARFLILAARRAMKSLSVKRAGCHYTRVIELSESGVVDSSLAEAMRGIVIASSGSGRDSEIAGYFEQAFRYYVSEGRIDLALDVAQIRFIDTEGMSVGIAVYESALELAEKGSRVEANIMGRLGRSVGMVLGDYPRAQKLLEHGIGIARELDDPNLEMQLCGDGVNVAFFNGEYRDSLSYSSRVKELSVRTSDPLSESGAYLHLGLFNLATGKTHEGIDYLKSSLAHSVMTNLNERISSSHKVLVGAYIRVCDWKLAREHVELALELSPSDERVLALRVAIEAMTGDRDAFLNSLSEYLSTDEHKRDSGEGASTRYLQLAARALTDEGIAKEIERSIVAIERRARSSQLLRSASLMGRASLALEGRKDDCARLREYLQLENLPDLENIWLPGVSSLAGMIAEAETEFDRLISLSVQSGQLFNEAWLRFDYATHLVSHSKSETAIARAISVGRRVATKSGINPLAKKYDLLETKVAGRKKRIAGLTRRELEILRLVFSGKSNVDIADELTLSRHTVVRHLSNVYSKLNVSNRSEASKVAVELGLVETG